MNEIPPITTTSVLAQYNTEARRTPTTSSSLDISDTVDISDLAQRLSQVDSGSSIRADRVAQIREAIRNGTYETPEKIDYTVSRLMDVLLQG